MTTPGGADAPAPPDPLPDAEPAGAKAPDAAPPAVSPQAVPLPTAGDLPLKEALPHPGEPAPPTESARPRSVEHLVEATPVTRSACTLLGLKLYAGGAAVPVLAALAMPFLQFKGPVRINWENVGLALYLIVPPAALLGAAMGFECYRLVCRSRRPVELPGWLWLLFFLVTLPYGATFWLAVPLFLHSSLRRDVLTPGGSSDMKASLLHFLYLLAWPVVVLCGMAALSDALQSSRGERLWEAVLICVWGMFWICDYLLLLTLASWRIARLLEKPPSHTVQYSLGTLMMAIFGVGAWVSGLVAIFRP
ncbi:MAG: hypothetical protein KIS92_23315 [Planctomycetota bacterium]|nr:hypothetical protein [Planctomycetota bacterium]